jgi:thiamine biosynthesis lipoprotein ApbE
MMGAMLPILLAVVLGASAPAPTAGPVRLQGDAFGFPVTVEARSADPEAARAALEAALAEIAAIERLVDPAPGSGEIPDGGVAVLNAAAGAGPQPVDPRLMPLLAKARDFCVWNEGAHGPCGGEM